MHDILVVSLLEDYQKKNEDSSEQEFDGLDDGPEQSIVIQSTKKKNIFSLFYANIIYANYVNIKFYLSLPLFFRYLKSL